MELVDFHQKHISYGYRYELRAPQILHNSEELDTAYSTCRQVLFDLNETIPDTIGCQELTAMVKETGEMLKKVSEDGITEMKAMDSVGSLTLKFLSLLVRSLSHVQYHATIYSVSIILSFSSLQSSLIFCTLRVQTPCFISDAK